jgi:hypothetical protein
METVLGGRRSSHRARIAAKLEGDEGFIERQVLASVTAFAPTLQRSVIAHVLRNLLSMSNGHLSTSSQKQSIYYFISPTLRYTNDVEVNG